MANLPADLHKLLEWLDRVSSLLEAQIVAAGLKSHARQGADPEFCRDEPARSDRLDHGPRTRCIEQIFRHAPSHRPAHCGAAAPIQNNSGLPQGPCALPPAVS
jgi:hypothetical protein